MSVMLRLWKLLYQIAILFGFNFIGEWIQDFFGLFIPGSVIGLILLFIVLSTGLFPSRFIEVGAGFMMKHLVLFFIPATVGILNFYHLFVGKGLLLIVVTMISSLLVMLSSGFTSQFLAKAKEISHE